ncbi:MAG: ferrous iron transport protein B [Planctomycetota bacterium]|nr:MAG: ferrous iron transport protein B [Planctomycetota bacterium]
MAKQVLVALAGNPNSGKTSIFNALTGARQRVANYPGVTVEKKLGTRTYNGFEITFVDLPGTYSLTTYSIEELIARNFIVEEHPDVVVDIIDASNVERNLYLAIQLMEMNVPLVLAFNMSDVAKQRGLQFDIDKLSELIAAPIVETVGNKAKGIDELLDVIIETAEQGAKHTSGRLNYGNEIEEELAKLTKQIKRPTKVTTKYSKRWLAIKLLENDKEIMAKGFSDGLLEAVDTSRRHLAAIFGDEPEMIIAERRYGFISGACQETVKSTTDLRHDMSDTADAVLTHRVLGLPIFIAMMYLAFQLTFSIGAYPMGWLETFFAWLARSVGGLWPAGAESALRSLLVDGVIGGVGGVIVFLPNILLLFAAIAFLEDSGYMARAAFIMDRIMHKIGLHGKSFIPMLIGFGCSIPAIMATRILENRRNRLTTMLVTPLMSCGARFTIYALIIPAFFAQKWRAPVLWLIYLIGIVLAIVCAKLLRKTLFRGETVPFVIELPPYRMPTARGLLIHTWQRGWMYLKKAGTIILAISIILWAASSYPKPAEERLAQTSEAEAQKIQLQYSVTGRIGAAMEPVIKPLGFDWRIGTALIGAMAAKEVFVSQLGIVYSLGETDQDSDALRAKLQADYTPLQGFCIMLFCLISAPCVATIAVTKREADSWGWALFQFTGLTVMAYVITLVVYQLGSLLIG